MCIDGAFEDSVSTGAAQSVPGRAAADTVNARARSLTEAVERVVVDGFAPLLGAAFFRGGMAMLRDCEWSRLWTHALQARLPTDSPKMEVLVATAHVWPGTESRGSWRVPRELAPHVTALETRKHGRPLDPLDCGLGEPVVCDARLSVVLHLGCSPAQSEAEIALVARLPRKSMHHGLPPLPIHVPNNWTGTQLTTWLQVRPSGEASTAFPVMSFSH